MKISILIEMLENSKERLGDVEVYIKDEKVCGINNESNHIEIISQK